MDPQTAQRKLHPFVQVADGNASESAREDVHLLFEYNLGDIWGTYTAPRANRFIVHNDYSNMMLESLESFVESLASFQPALVVVSGLQMLDNFPLDAAIRTLKLVKLQRALSLLPSSVKIHFEMASITEEKLIKELLEYVIPYTDSLGMNEQELANLCSMLEFGNVTIVSDPYPRVAKALDQIRSLHSLLEARKSASKGHRDLSRIHVHTLAYQAILLTRDSVWRNMNGAVAKASLTAHRYICASNQISVENARIIMDDSFSVSAEPGSHRMPLVDSAPVSCWSEEAVRFCVAPNLVCTAVRQTGGGGDNVSAAGLVLQL
jgi:ADP-dependent glucokinase